MENKEEWLRRKGGGVTYILIELTLLSALLTHCPAGKPSVSLSDYKLRVEERLFAN